MLFNAKHVIQCENLVGIPGYNMESNAKTGHSTQQRVSNTKNHFIQQNVLSNMKTFHPTRKRLSNAKTLFLTQNCVIQCKNMLFNVLYSADNVVSL